jgi:hypothetical protein
MTGIIILLYIAIAHAGVDVWYLRILSSVDYANAASSLGVLSEVGTAESNL